MYVAWNDNADNTPYNRADYAYCGLYNNGSLFIVIYMIIIGRMPRAGSDALSMTFSVLLTPVAKIS